MTSSIMHLNDKNWNKTVIESDIPVFVMFYSPTCAYCKNIKPHFEKYAKEFNKTVLFGIIDATVHQELASLYGVMGTPTFSFFCKGKIINSIVGSVYPTLLKKTVDDGIQFGENCRTSTSWFDPGITGYA